jgi:SAM-dependent methyltransferase
VSSTLLKQIKRWLRDDLVEQPLATQVSYLTEWFDSPCGQLLLENERAEVAKTLPSLFGYHLLQLSVSRSADLVQGSPIHHRVTVIPKPGEMETASTAGTAQLIADFDMLPIDSDSIDVIVLHHLLEFSPNPHQILKEVNRVLIPRGHVIIIGFNPYSLFGLWKRIASLLTGKRHWRYSAITRRRLLDWFKFLDLEKTAMSTTFFRPPCQSAQLLKRLSFLESFGQALRLPMGGAYIVVARKDVCAVTPIKAPWEKNHRRMLGMAAARPSSPRSYRDHSYRKRKSQIH